ncbi:DUF7673 family protein [Pseudomonas mosselii]|uniref:DUF7673 family protein n=1 Tax=Pseudomonas mosselii TaxID=78327 RepID=UPI002447F82A|nr:hypothetical protein [Pseudomonas mosselii]MDH1526730.1 hypothetical protein [Pseudomonas mosselii]
MLQAQKIGEQSLFDALVQFQCAQTRTELLDAGPKSLARLVPVALRETGESRVVGRFLLGLHDAQAHPFALTDLRSLDIGLFEDCLCVLYLAFLNERAVQDYLPRGRMIFNQLREYWA